MSSGSSPSLPTPGSQQSRSPQSLSQQSRRARFGYGGETGEKGRKVPAWAMSLLLHLALVLSLAFFFSGQRRDGIGESDRQVGVAVAHRMADRTEYQEVVSEEQNTESGDTATSDAATASAAAAPPAIARPVDLAGLLAEATETPLPESGNGLASALEAGNGGGEGAIKPGDGGGPEATTMFFGVSGSGRRFVYVIDRSESMNNNDARPLRAAKREVIRSLGLLTEAQAFQIIYYNNRPSYFEPQGQAFWMLPADENMKRRAAIFVRNMTAFGGTEHYDALKLAIKLEPDVIFMLTDADRPRLRSNQLDEIRARCQRSGTTIHAIEFGDDVAPSEDTFLRVLAQQNGGEYRYIRAQDLPVVSSEDL